MDRKAGVALAAFGLAAFLGIAGDLLLRVGPWGLNAFIAAVLLGFCFQMLVRRLQLPLKGAATWLWVTVPELAAVLVWRDSPPLITLAVLGVVLALVSTALIAHRRSLLPAGVWDLMAAGVTTGMSAAFGIALLAGETRPAVARWMPWNTKAGAVVRGAALAVPPLLVFGMLFASADEAFAQLLSNLVDIDWELAASHVALAGFFTWLAAGWLYWVAISDGRSVPRSDALPIRVGAVEVGVALGLVIALFVAFIAVQSTYLFGGEALVQSTTGLTYAEYARSGFFELVTAAVLLLPLLLVALWFVRDEALAKQRVTRLLAGVFVALIYVIMASALYRMRLYQDAYGQTHLRFLTTAFIIWLGVVFVMFSITVLRGAARGFVAGVVSTALAAVVLLAIVNPDARIVKANVQHARGGGEFDAAYLRELSADAVPAVVAALPQLPAATRCATAHWLVTRWGSDPARDASAADWRTWNHARAKARQIVRADESELRALACAPTPPGPAQMPPQPPGQPGG